MGAFQNLVRLIANGDPVDEATLNSVLGTLDSNTRYVLDLVRTALMGQALFAREVSVADSVLVGSPVWWNPQSQVFEPALASADADPESGEILASPQSYVWGVCYKKHNSTRADLLLVGKASLNIAGVTPDGQQTAGVYYLSGSVAGRLVKQEPAVSVPVLYADGYGQVLVMPRMHDPSVSHRHYKYELKTIPAGDHLPPPPGSSHSIQNPDPAMEGWLPADHPIFQGKAPAGAKFGYNIQASPRLSRLWPPVPVSSAYLEWDRGELPYLGAMGVPLGPGGLAILDANGIWWLSDCYGDVPWPNEPFTLGQLTGSSSSSTPACPRELSMRMAVYFTRMVFQSRGSMVNSLRVASGSEQLLFVRCQDGSASSTGHLEIGLSLPSSITDDPNALDPWGIKAVTNNRFVRGPLVTGVRSSSSLLVVTGSLQDGATARGEVEIALLNTALGRELPIELVKLAGVTEEAYLDTVALGFPPGRQSSYRGKILVPQNLDASQIEVQFEFWLMGSTTGALPPLSLAIRILPQATASPRPLPSSDAPLGLAIPADSLSAWHYLRAESSPIAVNPGDLIYFSLARNGASDGYTGEVHVLAQRLRIVSVS